MSGGNGARNHWQRLSTITCFATLVSGFLATNGQRYVTVETSNGVNNQKESILNGLLVAKALDATFVLPMVYPIWYKDAVGNSDGKSKWSSAEYRSPWKGMDVSGRKGYPLSSLFDEESITRAANEIGITVAPRLPRKKMKIIPVPFSYKWNWFTGVDEMIKRRRLQKLPSNVHIKFTSIMGMFRPTRPEHGKERRAKEFGGVWYCNRTQECGALCLGMRSNSAIMEQVDSIIGGLPPTFTAVHWRMFQCKDYVARATRLVESLLERGVPKGSSIYLLTGVRDQAALDVIKASFKVTSKLDFNPSVMMEFPFSALALIDFEVAIRATRFYGIELLEARQLLHLSTFSAFAVQLRSMKGMHNALLPADTFC